MATEDDLRQYVQEGLSLARVAELKAAFDLFDITGSGVVKAADLERALIDLQLTGASSHLYLVLSKAKASDQNLRFTDFIKLFSDAFPLNWGSFQGCQRLFDALDSDRSGVLTAKKLMEVAQQLGEPLGCEEAAEMIFRADRDGDGAVDVDDFYRIMSKRK